MDDSHDLDRVAGELGTWTPSANRDTSTLDRWLNSLVSRKAADLFLVAGFPPAIRLHGVVTPLAEGPLDCDDIEAAIVPSLHAHALKSYKANGSADVSLRKAGLGRFRLNV